jgi:thiamine-monophosphate kinase
MSDKPMAGRGEFALIDWIRRQFPQGDDRVTIGPGDDMAEVRLPAESGGRVLIGTDTILDGTHFDLRHCSARDVGWKALAVNLSDAAAMASTPLAAVGTLALPRDMDAGQVQELVLGLKACAEAYHCAWVGGDITAWDHPLAVTVTLLSTAERPVTRGGARPGDIVAVTGKLGGSLQSGRHLTFEPRVREALLLAEAVEIGAMMDLSDGLSSDLNHICDESGVGAVVELDLIPCSAAAHAAAAADGRLAVDQALNDGEDFELLFTVRPEDAGRLRELTVGPGVTVIGRIVEARQGRVLVDSHGHRSMLVPGGYEHWK